NGCDLPTRRSCCNSTRRSPCAARPTSRRTTSASASRSCRIPTGRGWTVSTSWTPGGRCRRCCVISSPWSGRSSDAPALTAPERRVRPLVIELVGPAGAGKSTLARQLGDRLGASGLPLGLWGLPLPRLAAHAARLVPTFWGFVRDGQRPLWAEQTQLVRLEP